MGWGLLELSRLGTTPWGGSFIAPTCPQEIFLDNFQAHPHPLRNSKAPLPCSPSPGAQLAAAPARPLRPGSSLFLTPQQMDTFAAPTSGLSPDYHLMPASRPSQSFLPSPAPRLHPSILPDPHLFEVPAGPDPVLPLPSPSTPP